MHVWLLVRAIASLPACLFVKCLFVRSVVRLFVSVCVPDCLSVRLYNCLLDCECV